MILFLVGGLGGVDCILLDFGDFGYVGGVVLLFFDFDGIDVRCD